jgi:hypothetical protein
MYLASIHPLSATHQPLFSSASHLANRLHPHLRPDSLDRLAARHIALYNHSPLSTFFFFYFNYVAIPTNLPPLIFLIGLFSTSELYICRLSAIRFPVAGKTERFRRGGIHDVASSKGFAFIPRRSTIRRGTWPVFVPFFFPLNISQHPCFLCCLQLGLLCKEDYQIPTFYDAKF